MKRNYYSLIIQLLQAAAWVLVLLTATMMTLYVVQTPDKAEHLSDMIRLDAYFALACALYFLNFYLLDPRFNQPGTRGRFLLVAVGVTTVPVLVLLPSEPNGITVGSALWLYLVFSPAVIVSSCFSSLLSLLRARDSLAEARQKQTEAELAMLKYQLNPHFLFNTLNNISSLAQIDADEAQATIARLSEMLRYMLYDSGSERVPLKKEVEFLRNYIQLMRLRCNSRTDIAVSLPDEAATEGQMIAPLLFVSLVENAFKHGISSRQASFVRIKLSVGGGRITFTCDNSYHPKPGGVNSGVGLPNLERRLQLAYRGRHRYEHTHDTATYHAQITLDI